MRAWLAGVALTWGLGGTGCGHATSNTQAPANPKPTERHADTPGQGSQPGSPAGLETSQFISVLPVHVGPRAARAAAAAEDDAAFARQLSVVLHITSNVNAFGELTRRTGHQVTAGQLTVSDVARLQAAHTEPATPAHLASTFVIDHGEPAVAALAARLVAKGAPPDAGTTAAFVADFIVNKTYSRGFDFPSRVAETRAGDCTEHAVLTAALLRHQGIPARVVLGIALLGIHGPQREPTVVAFGHAWVEHHDGSSWRVADAALHTQADTLPAQVSVRRAYLPITVMRDEGPGYARAWLTGAGVEHVAAVELQ